MKTINTWGQGPSSSTIPNFEILSKLSDLFGLIQNKIISYLSNFLSNLKIISYLSNKGIALVLSSVATIIYQI